MSLIVRPTVRPLLLLVEAEPTGSASLRHRLEQCGFEIVEAGSGEQALLLYESVHPDLVMLDALLPYQNGFELLWRLRAQRAWWAPVLMLIERPSPSREAKALQSGADAVLVKSLGDGALAAHVCALLRLGQRQRELERRMRELERRNSSLRRVLSRYLPHELVDLLLDNPTEKLQLGGASHRVTVLHADIRGFTPFSAQRSAHEVILALNRIWDRLVPLVFRMQGTFDKYIGDAIMAFYGAPVALENSALRATHTALAMQEQFAALQREQPEYRSIGLGIGIFTGDAVVGNVGSREHIADYTVVGSVPNAAERLQELARAGQILICEATYQAVCERVATRPLAPLTLRGIPGPIQPHEVLERRNQNGSVQGTLRRRATDVTLS